MLSPMVRPTVRRVFTWPNGIPQFVVGHWERMERIESELKKLRHLHLASNAYFRISLTDLVEQASEVVHGIQA
jgi:oxygen-dependent protoporphyrinogen oxidase